jgi:hypothetical protein
VDSIYRVARKLLYYRPIQQTLKELLSKPGFLMALNYKFIKAKDSNYEDVQDGINFKKHQNQMNKIYKRRKENEIGLQLKKVNIFISQFYDGVQIYNNKVADYWPLLFTILNLPPNIRNKIGFGMFLLSVFSSPQGSNAEKFLFKHCFISELQLLQRGVIMKQGKHNFFVQVRIIQHCMDTKAIGKELHVQEVGSLIGCPFCRGGFYGTYRHDLKKTVYGGNRVALPYNHFLRYIGQSQCCCPPNYYNNFDVPDDETEGFFSSQIENQILKTLKALNTGISQRLTNNKTLIRSCIQNTADNNMLIKKHYLDKNTHYTWFHPQPQFDLPHFSGNTFYFMHCDLRPQIEIRRRNQTEFYNDGMEAKNSNNKIVVNGVKDVWPFEKLFYADVEFDVNYDGFHCLYGVCKQISKLFKGKKKEYISSSFTKFCRESKVVPSVWTKWSNETKSWIESEYRPPWLLTQNEQDKVDAWLNAVLIPKTYSNHFQIKNMFKHFGLLRGNSFIVLFTVAIDYFITALPSALDKHYKLMISMLGSDISELLSPSFEYEDVESIHNRIIETVCALEGIFSEKQCTFILHELLHLAKHIHQMGPLNGWWTFAGERAMHFVKKFVKKGGRSFDKTAMIKYDLCESAITENKAFNNFEVDGDLKDNFSLTINQTIYQMEYDNNRFYLFQKCKKKKNCSFSSVESNYLLECLLGEVYKACRNYDEAYENSSYFRLHSYYTKLLGNLKHFVLYDNNISSFKDFLFSIYNNNGDGKKDSKKNQQIILTDDEKCTVKSVCLFLTFQKNFIIYKKAIIYGLRFTARGIECIETDNPTVNNNIYGRQGNYYKMNNSKNNINVYQNWSTQYSCWCRYKINKLNFDDDLNPSFFYGQLNYFFRFKCESDNILHGLPIANLVPRNYLEKNTVGTNPLGVDKIPCEESFIIPRKRDRNFFIPLTNFSPTAILIVPFDDGDEGKPIYIKQDLSSSDKSVGFYSDNNQISYMLAFDLHPNRKYSTFDKSKQKRYNKFSIKELNQLVNEESDDEESDEESEEESVETDQSEAVEEEEEDSEEEKEVLLSY